MGQHFRQFINVVSWIPATMEHVYISLIVVAVMVLFLLGLGTIRTIIAKKASAPTFRDDYYAWIGIICACIFLAAPPLIIWDQTRGNESASWGVTIFFSIAALLAWLVALTANIYQVTFTPDSIIIRFYSGRKKVYTYCDVVSLEKKRLRLVGIVFNDGKKIGWPRHENDQAIRNTVIQRIENAKAEKSQLKF